MGWYSIESLLSQLRSNAARAVDGVDQCTRVVEPCPLSGPAGLEGATAGNDGVMAGARIYKKQVQSVWFGALAGNEWI